jgi:hypothetical protein
VKKKLGIPLNWDWSSMVKDYAKHAEPVIILKKNNDND